MNICENYLNEILTNWYKNKEHFINLFQGKNIYTFPTPVSINLTEEEVDKLFDSLIKKVKYLDSFKDYLLKNRQSFLDNIVTVLPENFDEHTIKIKKGMKLIKSFKYFFPDNPILLREIQDAASRILFYNNLKGYLHLSISPYDFLSMSINNSNWVTCAIPPSEIPLSLMQDSTTLLLYLTKEKDKREELKGFPKQLPWNNKIWRMTIHINESYVCFGRQYPFQCTDLIKLYIIERFLTQNAKFIDTSFNQIQLPNGKTKFCFMNYFFENGQIYPSTDICYSADMSFNDFSDSPFYAPTFYYRDLSAGKRSPVRVGEEVRCLVCGKRARYGYVTCAEHKEPYGTGI